jgi:hypothetical protein
MIDVNATRGFADFCKALKQAQTNPYVAAQIEDHKRAAAKHFNVVYDQMAGFNEMLDDIAKAHPPAHLRAFRGGERISREMMSALTRLVAITAKKLYDELWDRRLPQLEEIPNTFIFRYALCMHFAALHALKIGRRANQGKLVNSLVDITLATYATFFDGILSEDKEANLLYSLTSFYLDGLRRVPIEEVRGLLR